MSRILGLDFGSKRIGVAVSDPLRMTAQAVGFLDNTPQLISKITSLIEEKEIELVILGNPIKLNGSESQKSQEVECFKNKLSAQTDCPIQLWDERLSTVSAQKHLIAMDVSRQKRKQCVDSIAAVFILQGYLDYLSHQNPCGL